MGPLQSYKHHTYALLRATPGQRVLDVGCGDGVDVLALADQVGPRGRVVGVDTDACAVAQARERGNGSGLPVDFEVGDAHALTFSDAAFDACRADCTFQHLAEPRAALAELARVARPGARVVVSEPDWETLVLDTSDRALTRRILSLWCDRIVRNGWIGRALPALFHAAGLAGVEVVPVTLVLDGFAVATRVCPLAQVADSAASQGLVARDEATAWIRGLEEASRSGRFFAALTGFVVAGQRP